MTEKLYYDNPYLKEWAADVLDIVEKNGKYHILLDKTAFYPEGGGQPYDKGYLDNTEVLYVYEEGKNIYQVTDRKPEKNIVSCSLDFERRYDLMQQHTGQHLLSSVFSKSYKGETSSFHLGDDYVSIDISLPEMPENIINDVEQKVNELIYSNLAIKTYMVNNDELNKLPLRKTPKVDEDIRIVEIDNIDFSPCCGTHVKSTGELGIIKIIRTEKYKGITRVYFKCGKRAFGDFQNKQNIVLSLSRLLAVDLESLVDKVKDNNDQLRNNAKEIKELKETLYIHEASEIIKSAGSNIISINFDDRSFDDVQNLGRILVQAGDYLVILSANSDKKLYFAHNGSFDIHCGKVFKENLQKFNGRGGGGDKQAQAGFESVAQLCEFGKFLAVKYNI